MCESLEGRQLLSGGFGGGGLSGMGFQRGMNRGGNDPAETVDFNGDGGSFERGGFSSDRVSFANGGGNSNGFGFSNIFANGRAGNDSPFRPYMGWDNLQSTENGTALKNDVPSGAKPSYASIGTLMDDLDAIKNGTLTGTEATTKVQADEAAALAAIGVTADQIAAIQADEAALVEAIKAANTSSSSDGSTAATSSAKPHDPMEAMTDVPLLPFLTQLRQNDSNGPLGASTSPTSTTTSDTSST